jgi:hypothetical protein
MAAPSLITRTPSPVVVVAALEAPCPDPTCPSSPGQYCYPASRGFHPGRYDAAVERVAADAARNLGRRPRQDDAESDIEQLARAQRLANGHDRVGVHERGERARARRDRIQSRAAAAAQNQENP